MTLVFSSLIDISILMDKRSFLKTTAALGALPFSSLAFMPKSNHNFPSQLPKVPESELWKTIRDQYSLTSEYINLESGYYNIIPNPTLERLQVHLHHVNFEGSYYMRNQLEKDRKIMREKLGSVVGCAPDNLIVTRNTTESLDTIISGYPWKAGDEVIYALQDYGAMKLMFEQVAERHGVKVNIVSVPNHPHSDEEIVDLYASKITSKTKMLMVCHMINITGQILPIKKICAMAHQKGVEVLVDGAHCVGHFPFSISDLGCDYYGSSLHKWLAAPLGNGLLYIASEHIPKIWPLYADYEKDRTKIKRLNHLGTHPAYITLGIQDAIDYLNWIGPKRKEERLRSLRRFWMTALKDVPNVVINTPWDPKRACGIGNIGLKNITPHTLAERLYKEHSIFTVAIDYANVKGCRITPNVFTSFAELDRFIAAIKTLAKA